MGEEKTIGDWRPDNWPKLKAELARLPIVWSLNKPIPSHEETIIEATASKILEAYTEYERCKTGAKEAIAPVVNPISGSSSS